jgi:hypothetical protein
MILDLPESSKNALVGGSFNYDPTAQATLGIIEGNRFRSTFNRSRRNSRAVFRVFQQSSKTFFDIGLRVDAEFVVHSCNAGKGMPDVTAACCLMIHFRIAVGDHREHFNQIQQGRLGSGSNVAGAVYLTLKRCNISPGDIFYVDEVSCLLAVTKYRNLSALCDCVNEQGDYARIG